MAGMIVLATAEAGLCQFDEKILLVNYDTSFFKERTISFPTGKSMGSLTIDHYRNGLLNDTAVKRKAAGTIKVPAGSMVTLIAEYPLLNNPALLKNLAPDTFDRFKTTKLPIELPEDAQFDRVITYLKRFPNLQCLDFNYCECTDAGITQLSGMQQIRSLSLAQTPCKGEFLRDLTGFEKLEQLDLSYDPIDNKNLLYLTRFPKLRILQLDHLHLGEQGLRNVATDTNIKCLNLSNNKDITDKNIGILRGLKNLVWLRLTNTSVTPLGLLQLKGLPLQAVVLRNSIYKKKDLDAVRAAFPRLKLGLEGPKTIDDIDQTLLSPIH